MCYDLHLWLAEQSREPPLSQEAKKLLSNVTNGKGGFIYLSLFPKYVLKWNKDLKQGKGEETLNFLERENLVSMKLYQVPLGYVGN